MNKHSLYTLILVLLVLLSMVLFPRCANIVPPTGGPRDSIPPEIVMSTPANYSTNFSGGEIEVEFNELIQVRNVTQQFIVTPPQKERPEIRARGRFLYVNLNTELIPNTTYTLNFGQSIVDLNEGNPLTNFEFVFSTGDVIDSLYYSGLVLNAFDNKPVEDVVVMMYDVLLDSVPYNSLPLYANRTGEDGRFRLNNLRADTFRVFALLDVNNNYLYDDPAEEAIAFRDGFITPDSLMRASLPETPSAADTLKQDLPDEPLPPADTLKQDTPDTADTLKQDLPDETPPAADESPAFRVTDHLTDSLLIEDGEYLVMTDNAANMQVNYKSGDTLFLFQEKPDNQYLSRNERSQRERLLFVFNRPLDEEWTIEPLNFEPPDNWRLIEKNPAGDSIRYWITDSGVREIDQMSFLVSYQVKGPSDSIMQVSDTVNMNYTAPVVSRRQAQNQEAPSLGAEFKLPPGGFHDLNKDLRISFPVPLSSADLSKTSLVTLQNGNTVPRTFELLQDSLRLRNYRISTGWVPGMEYRFNAEPGAFTSITGIGNDSIELSFTTREADYYGAIMLALSGVDTSIVIQLLDEKDQVLREYFTDTDGIISIDFLAPQGYRFKVIFDENNNGKWDSGNYLMGIQPERVLIFNETITTRSNWDIEVEWHLDRSAISVTPAAE